MWPWRWCRLSARSTTTAGFACSSEGWTVAGSGPASGKMSLFAAGVPRFELHALEAALEHRRIPAHAAQPRRRHPRPDPGIVDQHDPCAPDAEPAVGLLHQLAAGRHHRSRQVAGAVLGRVADIHHIEGAPVGLALPFGELGAVDRPARHSAGRRPRRAAAPRRRPRPRPPARAPVAPGDDPEPGEVPRHRAVLQRDDAVRHAGVDQGLRADDAARPPAAIDDDKRVL